MIYFHICTCDGGVSGLVQYDSACLLISGEPAKIINDISQKLIFAVLQLLH